MDQLAPFFTDFAVDAVYTPSSGTASTIKVIFDNKSMDIQVEDGSFEFSGPQAICKSSDVSSAAHNDTLVIGGVTYYITGIHPDGTGLTTLILSKDQA